MSESGQANITLISDQQDVIDSLMAENQSNYSLNITTSVDSLTDQDPTNIVIYDIHTVNNDPKQAIKDIIQVKQQDPTKVFILIGDKEPLSEVLKSHIQPAIYRAFNKPVSANQVILSFKSGLDLHKELIEKQQQGIDISVVGPEGNYANLDSIASEKNNKPVIIGLVVLALIVPAILFFASNGDKEQATNVTNVTTNKVEKVETTSLDNSNSLITELNQNAEIAILENRLISPKNDNALHYYNRVLAIDPYDITAYEGKKLISDNLRTSFKTLLKKKEFDKALNVINTLTKIEPLNIKNDEMHGQLQNAITKHIADVKASGNDEEINKTASVLEKIESDFSESKGAIDALKAEKAFLSKIDAAFTSKNLTPPKKGNAYSLISEALKDNKVSKENLDSRIEKLASKLIKNATNMANNDNLEGANKLAALANKLNVNKSDLNTLTALIEEKSSAKSADQQQKTETAVKEEIPAKIIPAKVISRASPKYPKRALQKKIEGWVDLKFTIDTKGGVKNITVNESSDSIFDKDAIKALKKWQFSPARNEQTGLPVESTIRSVKLSFRLG